MRMIKDGGFERVGLITEKKGDSKESSHGYGSGAGRPEVGDQRHSLVTSFLVLLIIFHGRPAAPPARLDVRFAERAGDASDTPPPTDQIIVSITATRSIPQQGEGRSANIAVRLQEVSGTRVEDVFFSAEDTVKYADVMTLMGHRP